MTDPDPYEEACSRALALAFAQLTGDEDGAAILLDEVVGEDAALIHVAVATWLMAAIANTVVGDDAAELLRGMVLARQLDE